MVWSNWQNTFASNRQTFEALGIREARIPALIYARTCASRAYITHSLVQHASRVAVRWYSNERKKKCIHTHMYDDEGTKESERGGLKWGRGAPSSSPGVASDCVVPVGL